MSAVRARLGAAVTLVGFVGASMDARAVDARAEAAARAAIRRATNDYLATNYAVAASLLERALRACKVDGCTAATKVAVLRDAGAMRFRNGDRGTAKKAFTDALALDASVTLNPDYETADLRAFFDEIRGVAPAPVQAPPPPAVPQGGDFAYTPPADQAASAALPLHVEPLDAGVARVQVKYRGAAMSAWSRVDLRRDGKGYSGEIPCADVAVGPMRYWIQGFDASEQPIASSGSPRQPITITVRDAGAARCQAATPEAEESPAEPAQVGRTAAPPDRTYARWWVGVSGTVDFLSLPGGDDLCALTSTGTVANANAYYCTSPDGSDFPRRDAPLQSTELVKGQAGHLDGGVQPGDVRVFVAADYALSSSMLVGVRLGYVMNAYPGHAAVSEGRAFGSKIQVEGRFTYLFGDEPLASTGFSPMVFAGVGVAEFDGHALAVATFKNVPGEQPVVVWRTDGPAFIAAGGGFRYEFSRTTALSGALRLAGAFGGVGALVTYGPELAFQVGF